MSHEFNCFKYFDFVSRIYGKYAKTNVVLYKKQLLKMKKGSTICRPKIFHREPAFLFSVALKDNI